MLMPSISLAVSASYTMPGISTEPSEETAELPRVIVLMARCSLRNDRPEQGSHRTS